MGKLSQSPGRKVTESDSTGLLGSRHSSMSAALNQITAQICACPLHQPRY